ncbi:MAG: PAS domain-containing protein [Xanthomonadales bacterium]|nr:PAS domain-containing protein [Xanthomonadales bacterium]
MFLEKFANLSSAYKGQFDLQIILLSLIVATLTIYLALRISHHMYRVRKLLPWLAHAWWMAGALVMGAGIWLLYFIGLLALSLPVETNLYPEYALLYLVPAVVGAGLLLRVTSGSELSLTRRWAIYGILGLAMSVMQYAGIFALHPNAEIKLALSWCVLTLIAAVVLSGLVLQVWWHCQSSMGKRLPSMAGLLFCSLIFSSVALAVQQIAMSSVHFFPSDSDWTPVYGFTQDPGLASWVVAISVLAFSLLLYLAVRLGHQFAITEMVESGMTETLTALEDSSLGVITTDSFGTIKSLNQAAIDMFGYPAVRIVGENCLNLLPLRILKTYKSQISSSGPGLGSLINRPHDLVFSKADGTEFSAELAISPLSRRSGLEFVAVIRPNSALKQAESKLKGLEKKLELLLSVSPGTVYTRKVSHGLPFVYVSPNSKKLLGYSAESISSTAEFWAGLVHPHDVDRFGADCWLLRDKLKETIEYRIKSPDGSYRWISDSRHVICDESGRPGLLVGCWVDIHEQKEASINRELNNQRMVASLNYANMATWDWIIDTGEIKWSGNVQVNLGLPHSEAAEFESFIRLIHPDDRPTIKAAFRNSLLAGVPFDMEFRVCWPDATTRLLHSAGGLMFDEAGNPTHMVGVLREVIPERSLRAVPSTTNVEEWKATAG